MKVIIRLLICLIGSQSILFAQRLDIKPYTFVSNSNDTIDAELGTFKVLSNRLNSDTDSIQLSFIRFKSTNPNPDYPVVYLAGGPGGSGIATAKGKRFELFMKLRSVSDVIAFDQRGTGLSNQIPRCPYRSNFNLSAPLGKEIYISKTSENFSKCHEFWKKNGHNLEDYNTTENAKDLEDLRKILNVDKLSFLGISYGSHLAFEYIRLFENNVHKLALSSLEGPDDTIKLPQNTENFLWQIIERAKNNYGSTNKYPDLKRKIIAVHNMVKNKPVVSQIRNRKGQIDSVGISNFELQSAVATFYLKNPNDSRKLPQLYSKMYKGDFSDIAKDVMVMKKYVYSQIRPMGFSMDMQSGISYERRKLVANQIDNTVLGSTINFLLFEMMETIDFPTLPKEFRKLEPNKVDALLLSGTMDGRTYVSSAKNIAKKFSNGTHVIVENGGHDLLMQSPLIGNLILDFFKGKSINSGEIVLDPIYFD